MGVFILNIFQQKVFGASKINMRIKSHHISQYFQGIKMKTYLLIGFIGIIFFLTEGCKKDDPTSNTNSNNPPSVPSNPTPINSATGISLSPELNWNCSDPDGDPLTYDVFFGTSNPPTLKVSTGQTTTKFSTSGLTKNTTYYWLVNVKDNKGSVTNGKIWNFTTQNSSSTSGTIAYWKFDETTGNTVFDSSGNNLTGSADISSMIVSGKIGNARTLSIPSNKAFQYRIHRY